MTASSDPSARLPDLERRVFEILRDSSELSVHEVHTRLSATHRTLAYTTVMTILSRLWQKGYLDRRQEGRAHLYAMRPSDEIARDLAHRAASQTLANFGTPALSGFVDALSPEQRALVAMLLAEEPGP